MAGFCHPILAFSLCPAFLFESYLAYPCLALDTQPFFLEVSVNKSIFNKMLATASTWTCGSSVSNWVHEQLIVSIFQQLSSFYL
jgi:hypothetical protein